MEPEEDRADSHDQDAKNPGYIKRVAARTYAVTAMLVVAFQVALALGAPWGAYAMGGVSAGQYPAVMRMGAVIQALLILMMVAVVLARAGLAFPRFSTESRWMIWLVVGLGAMTLLLNALSPSAGERLIWGPVALLLLLSSFVVAVGK